MMHLFIVKKPRKNSVETQTELAAICAYVKNQATPEPIPPYRASKCKQTKE